MINGKNLIGFTESAEGDKTFRTFNPKANLENEWQFYEASETEINRAASLASKAFTTYSKISAEKRATFLNSIADEILGLGDTLIEVYMKESGLPEGRAIGERGRTIGQLKMFAELIKTEMWRDSIIDAGNPGREPLPKPDLRQTAIPLGPIVVFGASNFPFAFSTAGGDTASAFAAGCPVIVKSHPMHAGTGEMISRAIVQAAKKTHMPEGVFSNLNSSGIEVGQKLVSHPLVKAVGFTGSLRGGRALYDLAAKRKEPIPVFAEMGSINPVVVTQKALENRGKDIATNYAKSVTLGAGQFCTNPGLILGVASDEMNNFVKELGSKAIEIEAQAMLHPNIYESFHDKATVVMQQQGADIVAEYSQEVNSNFSGAKIVTVSGKDFLENNQLHQEVFGPFSLVVQCSNKAELLQVIQNLEGQLTGTIIAEEEDYSKLEELISALQDRVGRIVFNGVPTGVEVSPAMTHGGPYPASTDSRFTAVGSGAIKRWVRPFSYQDFPKELLPDFLK
ncbi:MAG: aldehyde dehydrogenase (NADP(+)) [Flavobacteriaceae bacterium]|nr:aldehyde dehydrogenase (NADP(+)) [Flavobacteriaceae bacterium]